jgi:thioredoxin-dependent peroxiredoxin
MLAPGERAPEFALPDQSGRETSLTSLLNSGELLLAFFSGCPSPANTIHMRRIQALQGELQRRGLVVAGISPRLPAAHQKMREQLSLGFPLLSDRLRSVARMYDVKGLLGFGVRRGTYLISRGRVVIASVVDPFRIARHLAFMREAPERVLAQPSRF